MPNKQKAEILIGSQFPYQQALLTSTSTASQTLFQDYGTQLRLRPFIGSDGLIRMEVHPEISSPGQQGPTGPPAKNITQVTTNIMRRDGCTVFLGGLTQEELDTTTTQVPFLGSLPYAGWLFRTKDTKVIRTEILVLARRGSCSIRSSIEIASPNNKTTLAASPWFTTTRCRTARAIGWHASTFGSHWRCAERASRRKRPIMPNWRLSTIRPIAKRLRCGTSWKPKFRRQPSSWEWSRRPWFCRPRRPRRPDRIPGRTWRPSPGLRLLPAIHWTANGYHRGCWTILRASARAPPPMYPRDPGVPGYPRTIRRPGAFDDDQK